MAYSKVWMKQKLLDRFGDDITIGNEVVPVDPQLLFQRLLATVIRDNDIDMQQVFQYELSTSPASLFDEKDGLMRKADKPKLSAAIWKYVDLQMGHPKNASFVIDGEFLLQKIQGWPKGSTFKLICKLYKDYVLKHYVAGTTVVFDGGYDKPSTKDTTHLRRSKFRQGVVVHFTENMIFTMKKNEFLLNKVNKQHFLELLTREMNSKNLVAKQASCDADLDIVLAGLNASETQSTVIIGEDTDLLCLLLAHATDMHDIYFTSESKSNSKEKPKIWDIRQVRSKLGNQACKILVAHALLGIFGINKAVAFTKLKSEEAFGKYADVFLCPTSNQQLIIGEKLLLLVSGAKDEKTLDELRLFKFSQKIVTSTVAVQPESLGFFPLLTRIFPDSDLVGKKRYESIRLGLGTKR